MQFEWDSKKDNSNQQKHHIDFAEAATVFSDPDAAIFDDPQHSVIERREIIIGTSLVNNLLLVSFTERGGSLRIISARKANKKEKTRYENYQKTSN